MIQNALELTKLARKEIFVLYDDVGYLTLKNISNMKLNLLISRETAEDYEYKSSIDGETYNQIKLSYSNQDAGKDEIYMVKANDTIAQWGVLQLYEEIQEGVSGQEAAEGMLALYNKKTQSLNIQNAFGDIRVRAGCLLPVLLDLEDTKLDNWMLVEEVKHKFGKGHHSMDLKLKGSGFFG